MLQEKLDIHMEKNDPQIPTSHYTKKLIWDESERPKLNINAKTTKLLKENIEE